MSFSEPVTNAQVSLRDAAGQAITGTATMDASDTVLVFRPGSQLPVGEFAADVSDARDAAGNVMTAPYSWRFTTTTTVPDPDPVPGLVAAYGMDEGAGTSVADSSGQNNTGAGRSASWVDGKYGKALSFNGSSSWVTVEDAASLRLTTGMTVSAWVNPATVADWRSLVTKELAVEGASYSLYAANGGAVPSGWVQPDPADSSTVDGLTPLPVGTWSHLALTYDGAALRLLINGQQVDETAMSDSLYDDGSPLRIGGNGVWGEYFEGLIDEVRIYNRALTAQQIQADMNTPVGSTIPGPDPTPTPTPTPDPTPNPVPGLVAAYGMEEGTGTIVGDSSGQNNTGAATDTTWTTAGKHGKALTFNGDSSWVTVPHAPSLRLTTALTLSAWVRPSTTDALWHPVLMKENDRDGFYGLYSSIGEGPAGWLETADDEGGPAYWDSLPSNQWSHLALTYDGSNATLYVNGTEVDQEPLTGELIDDGGDLRIGGHATWREYFEGLIDEVRIYNIVQTAAQIQADMNTPIGAAPAAAAPTARLNAATTPAIDKLTVSADAPAGTTPVLTAWLTGDSTTGGTVEIALSHRPAKQQERAKTQIWTGKAGVKADSSKATVTLPEGLLKQGQEVRWRARSVADGVTGPWTSWAGLTVKDPKPEKATRNPGTSSSGVTEQPKSALAASTFPYERMDHDECQNLLKGTRQRWEVQSGLPARTFRHKNSFNTCFAMWIGERNEDDEVDRLPVPLLDDDSGVMWMARLTIVFHTYVGTKNSFSPREKLATSLVSDSREISAWIRVDAWHVFDANWSNSRKFSIKLGEAGFPGCTSIYKARDGQKKSALNGISDTVADWRRFSDDREIVLASQQSSHPDREGTCTVDPHVIYQNNPEGGDQIQWAHPEFKSKNHAVTFTCDSSAAIKIYTGGCISNSVRPVFVLDSNDAKVAESAYHWALAMYSPNATYPPSNAPKKIPGAIDWGDKGCTTRTTGCLHRTTTESVIDDNRNKHAVPACRKYKPNYKKPDSCDEFPFASTLEGAANTTYDFSVQIIKLKDNCASGSRTKWFYLRHRIRHNTSYWVDVIMPGQATPVSGALGTVVRDPLPDEESIVCVEDELE